MRLYNSLSGKIEIFQPIKENEVSMYVCGPTVYNNIHIGNTRPMIMFDILRRVFEYQGYHVIQMSNYTDVDDKIISVAIKEQVNESVITEKYIKAYDDIRDTLHVLRPNHTPKVTEHMDGIIAFIEELIQQNFAYVMDGDVYFRVGKIETYGQLSKQNMEELQVGARIDENVKKESPFDFTLWKATQEGIQWASPWSKGRPGWHTECVVMINEEFEEGRIDIHGGGMDLKFPHHDNEIAQSMALHHHPIATYWIHNAMLNIDGSKMSKSIGNVMLAKDLVAAYGSNVIRWMMISSHYRSPLNIADEVLNNAAIELEKFRVPLKQLHVKAQLQGVRLPVDANPEWMKSFIEALNDDLNVPNAMSTMYELVKQLNQLLRNKENAFGQVGEIGAALQKMLELLGIVFEDMLLSLEDIETYRQWTVAKANKDFVEADQYRAILQQKGIV